jgi:hypothetical protein
MNSITATQYDAALRSTALFNHPREAGAYRMDFEDRQGLVVSYQVDTSEYEYVQCTIDNDAVVTYQGSK